jgi:hypothetical protein
VRGSGALEGYLVRVTEVPVMPAANTITAMGMKMVLPSGIVTYSRGRGTGALPRFRIAYQRSGRRRCRTKRLPSMET